MNKIILLAEDDDDHFFIAKKAFEESKPFFILERVCNGKELIQRLGEDKQAPSLIILDLNMPKMDGREALNLISSHPQWSKTPVVVLTTSPNEEDAHLCLQKGTKLYLQKPTNFQSLVDIMHSFKELA